VHNLKKFVTVSVRKPNLFAFFIFLSIILLYSKNGLLKFQPVVVSSFRVIVLNNRTNLNIKLYSSYTCAINQLIF